jgi:hypothetical protein
MATYDEKKVGNEYILEGGDVSDTDNSFTAIIAEGMGLFS